VRPSAQIYAIADAIMALKLPPEHLRVVSVGVGVYLPSGYPVLINEAESSLHLGE